MASSGSFDAAVDPDGPQHPLLDLSPGPTEAQDEEEQVTVTNIEQLQPICMCQFKYTLVHLAKMCCATLENMA